MAFRIAALAFVAAALAPSVGPRAGEAAPPPAVTAPAERSVEAVAAAADLEDSGEGAKLTFELSAPVDVSAFVLADPDRVIVDAPQVEFLIDPEVGKARGARSPSGPVWRRRKDLRQG